MDNRDKYVEFFSATPPRLFPQQAEQRSIIEILLAQTAAENSDLYEERLQVFNAVCDKEGVPRFSRVVIVKEEIPAPSVEVPVTEGTVGVETVTATEVVEVKAKKSKKVSSPKA